MGQDEHRIARHRPRETHGARGQAGNSGLGPWTRRLSVALAERMRRGSEREAMLAGPGEPVSGPLLVELRKLNLPVTIRDRPATPTWFMGIPAQLGMRGARACSGASRRGSRVSEGGGCWGRSRCLSSGGSCPGRPGGGLCG